MKKSLVAASVFFLLICLAGCGGAKVHRSELWEVTIVSAGYQDNYQYDTYPPPAYSPVKKSRKGFVIQLEIGYKGPGDSAPAPEVVLSRVVDGVKIQYDYSKSEGIIVEEPEEKNDQDMVQGERRILIGKNPNTGEFQTAKIDYIYPVPNDKTEYLLAIGDIEPIKVKP